MRKILAVLAGLLLVTQSALAQTTDSAIIRYASRHHPVVDTDGMVASQNIIASAIGAEILADGGNAVDAAVGVGFALAVVLPRAGNIGGGGFMLAYIAETDETIAIDYREMAPPRAHRDMFLDEDGKSHSIVMGCYGIGVSRLIAAIIEQHHDEQGIRWPVPVAPYQVIVTPIGKDDAPLDKATEIYEALRAEGVEALLDDRPERPGVKFKDADLLGIPVRITVGPRGLKQGTVELKKRIEPESQDVPLDDAVARAVAALAELRG